MTNDLYVPAADDEATEEITPLTDADAQEVVPDNREGWFARLRARWFGSQARRTYIAERLVALTRAIERQPESPANYVIRGEVYEEIGERARAEEDFRTALKLAEAQFADDDWGMVSQALQDRAVAGLRRLL